MTNRLHLACLATALLLAGGAAAQPAPGTPADAEAATARLVEAARARDWPALAAFLDADGSVDLAEIFPAPAHGATALLRMLVSTEGIDADSLLAAADSPTASGLAARVRRYRLLLARIYADGPLGQAALHTRVLFLVARCDPDSTIGLFDAVRYAPVRADVREDGVVEVVGRVSGTADGESIDGLVVTPLRWAEGRWAVDEARPVAPDAERNPLAEVIGAGSDMLAYALFSIVGPDVDGALPACIGAGE